jgi:hypothetical protein
MAFVLCQPASSNQGRDSVIMRTVSEARTTGALRGRLTHLGMWNIAALAVWLVIFLVLAARILANPNRATAFTVYRLAGFHWLNAQHLYGDWRGFIYSPISAVFLPLSHYCRRAGAIFAGPGLTPASFYWESPRF